MAAAPPTDDPFAKAAAASSTSLLPTGGAVTGAGAPLVTFHRLPARYPYPPRPCSSSSTTTAASIYQTTPPAHHVVTNGTVTAFRNPWPSFVDAAHKGGIVHARWLSRERKYVPVPSKKEDLVQVVRPDWGWGGGGCGGGMDEGRPVTRGGGDEGGFGKEIGGNDGGGGGKASGKEMGDGGERNPNATKMKATWIGHASWLLETGVKKNAPIWTPSITLTMDDAGKVTTKMLDLKSDDEEEDDSDDDSSSSSSTSPGGPDDKKDHSAEKKETGGGKDKQQKSGKKKQRKEAAVERGLRILCDPVFSARMSPVRFAGPKRFTPPPCALSDLPDCDVVVISHDHYDHLDAPTIRFLVDRERKRQHRLKSGRGILFLCGLGVGRHLQGMGVREEEIVELDWWEGVRVAARGVKGAAARIVATPSQHFSGRGVWDAGKALWCSWVVEEVGLNEAGDDGDEDLSEQQKRANDARDAATGGGPRRLFFAGDTGYRSVPPGPAGAADDPEAVARLPRCPAFAEIGQLYGPFDLALLPIGCYSPRALLSPVHAAPEDAVCMHRDLRSRRSVGMHYGTVRMPLSEQYEDVREPPRRWREAAEREGLRWGEDVDVCMIGETVLV
ncbi:hypothetical protein SLS58_007314 [Diplodia intermedia]|uniref:Metallo-beta-lactamase domain-containing protein n=1 Tax=Diplodia intermedia TaxID=856260 RepID=A0ABR3TKH0_9PEZI